MTLQSEGQTTGHKGNGSVQTCFSFCRRRFLHTKPKAERLGRQDALLGSPKGGWTLQFDVWCSLSYPPINYLQAIEQKMSGIEATRGADEILNIDQSPELSLRSIYLNDQTNFCLILINEYYTHVYGWVGHL